MPGPPPAYRLTPEEIGHPDPRVRFARRTIALLGVAHGGEALALIDKASPHSRFDLMLSGVSAEPRSSPADVRPETGRALWATGYRFVRFCSQPPIAAEFGLAGGELHLALNCDPHTADRESVQAAKQIHLHLLYWERSALAPLAQAQPLGEVQDLRLRRQALDPLTFLGARLIGDALAGVGLPLAGARLLPPDDRAALRGERPLGCIVALPGWAALADPAFEALVRHIHLTLEDLAAALSFVFTGERRPPAPWHRHPLLPLPEIRARIGDLPCTAESRDGLLRLAGALRTLPERTARRLARGGATRRMNLMSLIQPAYSLSLHAPRRGLDPQWPDLAAADPVHLILQPRLFSGIGGAGLLTLGGVPSVRVLRGEGVFSAGEWRERARFQRHFARFCLERTGDGCGLVADGRVRRFVGTARGWV